MSVSIVGRDLNTLYQMGKLVKIHGGAVENNDNFSFVEHNVEEKQVLYMEEKNAISKYAVPFIKNGDFVFIDAGTTTEKLADYITAKDVVFVTNAFMGVNGISKSGGYFMPDDGEAIAKRTVMENSVKSCGLADHSKFSQKYSVTFSDIKDAEIVTDQEADKKYNEATNVNV